MEHEKNKELESFVKIVAQLSPTSLQLVQSNAEVLLARDKMEEKAVVKSANNVPA